MYSEPKEISYAEYRNISISPQETKQLFLWNNRTETVLIRSMRRTNVRGSNYIKSNEALRTDRYAIYDLLNRTAPLTNRPNHIRMDRMEYLRDLTKHRFVASPAGNGVDCHSTWEALLAGCIPIVPHSALDPMFQHLPVWLIYSWEEVTDETVTRKAKEMVEQVDTFHFDELFADWWKQEINNVGW
jgi:hypothetical protein